MLETVFVAILFVSRSATGLELNERLCVSNFSYETSPDSSSHSSLFPNCFGLQYHQPYENATDFCRKSSSKLINLVTPEDKELVAMLTVKFEINTVSVWLGARKKGNVWNWNPKIYPNRTVHHSLISNIDDAACSEPDCCLAIKRGKLRALHCDARHKSLCFYDPVVPDLYTFFNLKTDVFLHELNYNGQQLKNMSERTQELEFSTDRIIQSLNRSVLLGMSIRDSISNGLYKLNIISDSSRINLGIVLFGMCALLLVSVATSTVMCTFNNSPPKMGSNHACHTIESNNESDNTRDIDA